MQSREAKACSRVMGEEGEGVVSPLLSFCAGEEEEEEGPGVELVRTRFFLPAGVAAPAAACCCCCCCCGVWGVGEGRGSWARLPRNRAPGVLAGEEEEDEDEEDVEEEEEEDMERGRKEEKCCCAVLRVCAQASRVQREEERKRGESGEKTEEPLRPRLQVVDKALKERAERETREGRNKGAALAAVRSRSHLLRCA